MTPELLNKEFLVRIKIFYPFEGAGEKVFYNAWTGFDDLTL
jgi:hypothetical protein